MAPPSRKQAWMRDELILALDLYRREGRNPPQTTIDELSEFLRAMPVEPELAEDPKFRNPNAVYMKVANFVAIDPAAPIQGMTAGGKGDQSVWDEFSGDPQRLAAAAAAIRANAPTLPPAVAGSEEEEVADAPEGRVLTRVHRVRERNASLVLKKKAAAKQQRGKLACEACGFDFADRYGERGADFIECHHTAPVSTLKPGSRTKLADLALVCANCHRMIHRTSEWLTIDELRALIDEHKAIAA